MRCGAPPPRAGEHEEGPPREVHPRGETARAAFDRVRLSQAGRKMILGVDRLDYSKGLEERFLAYEQLLADHPDWAERVFLLQIATPSRDAASRASGSISSTKAS